jgi:hypothetical protein
MHRISSPSPRPTGARALRRLARTGRAPRLALAGTALGLAGALLTAGCGGDDDGLTVRGEVTATLDGGTSRFTFPGPTRLFDDRVAPDDGSIAGHCTIRLGRAGERDTLSFGLSRTGAAAPGDRGLRQLTVQIDDPAVPRGTIAATFGASETFAGVPGASCGVTVVHDPDGAYATLELRDCVVATATDTARLDGSLEFDGCTVIAP